MIGISKLYCGVVEPSDLLRYGPNEAHLPSHLLQFARNKKPVVVWNITRACNLNCAHCYAAATTNPASDELTLEEAEKFIHHLGDYGAPVILFSGGEPLLHPHIFHLIETAVKKGLRAVLSTNGLLINQEVARRLAGLGLSYVGVSLDGLAPAHDELRKAPGSFEKTINNIALARDAGLKVGLRLTLTRHNISDIPGVFDLMEAEKIPRICFYHLVSSGRGSGLSQDALSHKATRQTIDYIIERTAKAHANGLPLEVLTVDNHADGPYLYLKLRAQGQSKMAKQVLELLRLNGGNGSGLAIGAVSWNGDVHPDQFWRKIVLGSIKQNTFADIWHNEKNDLLMSLKNKKENVTGRCRFCVFLDCCAGNLRARAHEATGEIWGLDPGCYLTDEEISTAL
ncbi:MAG: radical SAM protein [Candidatus Adiutrix sp.]